MEENFFFMFLSLNCILRLRAIILILILILILARVTLHLRKTSLLGEGSRCRGGIVNTRCGCVVRFSYGLIVPRRFGGFV